MASTDNYRETQIRTASPMELIIMLYDECIRSLNQAEESFKIEGPNRLQEINNCLLHAQDIITELAVSLDMEKGGAIARNLQRVYDFMIFHLAKANTSKQLKPITEVRDMLIEFRETWQQVAQKEPQREPTSTGDGAGSILCAG